MAYLLDTHTLFFWVRRTGIPSDFVDFLDQQVLRQALKVSSIAFWEIGLLAKKGRLDDLDDPQVWCQQVLANSGIGLLEPTTVDMINSTLLPDFHKDPFDRLLIAQAQRHQLTIVTRDSIIPRYAVQTFWR